jgi:hypothetical protein
LTLNTFDRTIGQEVLLTRAVAVRALSYVAMESVHGGKQSMPMKKKAKKKKKH